MTAPFHTDQNENSPFSPVRLGLVGAGSFGRVHAATINGIVEAELVALVDSNPEALTAVSAASPGVLVWENLETAIAESEAEAWIVASPTSSHAAVAKGLLAAGKTILVEKPIALDVATAEELGALVSEDSSNMMMGHVALFNSEFRQLQKEVDQRGAIEFILSHQRDTVNNFHDSFAETGPSEKIRRS